MATAAPLMWVDRPCAEQYYRIRYGCREKHDTIWVEVGPFLPSIASKTDAPNEDCCSTGEVLEMESARAAVVTGIREIEIREFPVPDPAPGTFIGEPELAGICGTDVHTIIGHNPLVQFPNTPGHEMSIRIVKLGPGLVADSAGVPIAEGDRVYVHPAMACGICHFCRVVKEPTKCLQLDAYGEYNCDEKPLRGAWSERIYIDHPRTYFLKTNLPAKLVAMVEPLAVGVHGVMKGGVELGDTAVIQGAGAIGLGALVAAIESGATRTIVVGAPQSRLELAKGFGASEVVDITEVTSPAERAKLVREMTPRGWGADVVFECAGVADAVPEGIEMLRPAGRFIELGSFTNTGDTTINPYRHLLSKSIHLVGCCGDQVEHVPASLRILESGKYAFEEIISHEVPLDEILAAVEALLGKDGYRLHGKETRKVVVNPLLQS